MDKQGEPNSPPPKLPQKLSASSFREKKDVLGRAHVENRPVPKPRGRTIKSKHPSPTQNIDTEKKSPLSSEHCTENRSPVPSERPVPRPRTRTQSFEKISTHYLESNLDSFAERNVNNNSPENKTLESDDIYCNIDNIYGNLDAFGNVASETFEEDKFQIPPDADEAGKMVEEMVNARYESLADAHTKQVDDVKQSVPTSSYDSHSKIPIQRVEAFQRNIDKQSIYDLEEFIGVRPEKSYSSSNILIPQKVSPSPTPMAFVPGTTSPSLHNQSLETGDSSSTDILGGNPVIEDESKYESVWFSNISKTSQVKPVRSDLLNFPTAVNGLKLVDDQLPAPRPHDPKNNTDQWGEYARLDSTYSMAYEQPPPVHAPPPLPINVVKSEAPPVPPRPGNDPSSDWASSDTGSSSNKADWAAFNDMSSSEPSNNTSFDSAPSSAIFKQLETPQSNFYQDDPFKYSDFATECLDFNKASKSDLNIVGTEHTVSKLQAVTSEFDPFKIMDTVSQNSSTSASSSSSDPLRMSMVPPPPKRQTLGRQDIPTDNLYSVAFETPQDNETSDSSDELYGNSEMFGGNPDLDNTDPATMTVPIVCSPTPKASERWGYLYKQGGVKANKGWKRRWTVFNGHDLRYFVNNRSQISKRVIPLSCMKDVQNEVQNTDKDRFKFLLETNLAVKGRTFQFAAETLDDCLTWCQILMAAIHTYQKTNTGADVAETTEADKEGFVKFEPGHKYYVSIKGSKLCYYHTVDDYKLHSPIHEIPMELASVKDVPGNRKCKLQLTTNYAQFILAFENAIEAQQWKMAMEDAIAEGLSDDRVLMMVYKNDSNKFCADCEDANPHWASINLGIVLCKKCAGIHRMFDYRTSKIRSLRMDTRVWTPSLIEMMIAIGNSNANNFWEFDMLPEQKIEPDCNDVYRKQFIQEKYKDKKFIRPHRHQHDPRILNEELLIIAETDKLLDLMSVLFSGANIHYKRSGGSDDDQSGTAYHISKEAGQRLVMELLYQNGGDNSAADLQDADDGRLREDVRLQGHLMKTGPNNRGFENRWCILEHGALTYYEKEESTKFKDSIDRKTILVVQESAAGSEKQISSFELSTKKGSNRIYLFGAENNAERGMWMRTIGRLICPVSVMDHVGMMDFNLAGHFYMKNIITDEWRKTWMMLNWRVLHFVSVDSQLDTVDLRKAKGIKYLDTNSCEKCMETGRNFVVDTHGRHLYFQADLIRDTDRAFSAIENAIKKSGTSLSDQQLTADDVPVIVSNCIGHIQVHGVKDKGIYRESATKSKIEALLNRLKTDVYAVKLEEAECNEVANALKRFFRELEDSLFTRDLYKEWIRTAAVTEQNNKLSWYRYLRDKLPLVNKNTLKKLILHLWKVSQEYQTNMMTVENIATCFAPSLMRTEKDNSNTAGLPLEMAVITDLIKHREYVFEIQASDHHKEKLIDEAAAKIAAAHLQHTGRPVSNVFSHMMIPFHVLDTSGQSINATVHNTDTAANVLSQLKRMLPNSGDFAIYEVLKRGAIERPLLSTEYPLSAFMEWQNWEDDVRKEAKFIVKPSKTLKEIASAYEPGIPLFGELKGSAPGEKKMKKMAFKFIQAKLSSYKDAKTNHVQDEWNVEDLIFYLGVDPKRSGVSASHCITFVVKGEKQKGCFGRCMVFVSAEDKLRWMAALMTAQNSGTNLT